MSRINDLENLQAILKTVNLTPQPRIEKQQTNIVPVNQQRGDCKKITNEIIEQAINMPNGFNSVKMFLNNSPVGFGDMETNLKDLENQGFRFEFASMHLGAPISYKSPDGATITVYNGKGSAEMGEDRKKIVYQTDRYVQEMYYDDDGKLTGGKITVKDKVAGFQEAGYLFNVKDDKIQNVVR